MIKPKKPTKKNTPAPSGKSTQKSKMVKVKTKAGKLGTNPANKKQTFKKKTGSKKAVLTASPKKRARSGDQSFQSARTKYFGIK